MTTADKSRQRINISAIFKLTTVTFFQHFIAFLGVSSIYAVLIYSACLILDGLSSTLYQVQNLHHFVTIGELLFLLSIFYCFCCTIANISFNLIDETRHKASIYRHFSGTLKVTSIVSSISTLIMIFVFLLPAILPLVSVMALSITPLIPSSFYMIFLILDRNYSIDQAIETSIKLHKYQTLQPLKFYLGTCIFLVLCIVAEIGILYRLDRFSIINPRLMELLYPITFAVQLTITSFFILAQAYYYRILTSEYFDDMKAVNEIEEW